jgi:hypothetical protein
MQMLFKNKTRRFLPQIGHEIFAENLLRLEVCLQRKPLEALTLKVDVQQQQIL